ADTGTAYGILVRHGIARWFDTVVISEGLGLRKPHPAVARAGLRGLGLAAGEVLLVGDTYGEDVAGARAAGLDAAWIDARGQGVPDGAAPPRYVLRALSELAAPSSRSPASTARFPRWRWRASSGAPSSPSDGNVTWPAWSPRARPWKPSAAPWPSPAAESRGSPAAPPALQEADSYAPLRAR